MLVMNKNRRVDFFLFRKLIEIFSHGCHDGRCFYKKIFCADFCWIFADMNLYERLFSCLITLLCSSKCKVSRVIKQKLLLDIYGFKHNFILTSNYKLITVYWRGKRCLSTCTHTAHIFTYKHVYIHINTYVQFIRNLLAGDLTNEKQQSFHFASNLKLIWYGEFNLYIIHTYILGVL